MATKFLSRTGLKHFIDKVIGRASIDGIGDGTIKGAIASINQRFGEIGTEVNELSADQSTTIKTTLGTTISLYRKGNMVYIRHADKFTLANSGEQYHIATLPEAYRPIINCELSVVLMANMAIQGNARVWINSNTGYMYISTSRPGVQKEYSFSTAYLAKD